MQADSFGIDADFERARARTREESDCLHDLGIFIHAMGGLAPATISRLVAIQRTCRGQATRNLSAGWQSERAVASETAASRSALRRSRWVARWTRFPT